MASVINPPRTNQLVQLEAPLPQQLYTLQQLEGFTMNRLKEIGKPLKCRIKSTKSLLIEDILTVQSLAWSPIRIPSVAVAAVNLRRSPGPAQFMEDIGDDPTRIFTSLLTDEL